MLQHRWTCFNKIIEFRHLLWFLIVFVVTSRKTGSNICEIFFYFRKVDFFLMANNRQYFSSPAENTSRQTNLFSSEAFELGQPSNILRAVSFLAYMRKFNL